MATITTNEVLSSANAIINQTGVMSTKIVSIRQCNSTLLLSLYELLTGRDLPAKHKGVWSTSAINEAIRCQYIIDAVSELLPPVISLAHITGVEIAKCDLLSIKNLLDIFSILLINTPSLQDTDYDSDVLTDKGIQVINQVIEEELSSAHHDTLPSITVPSAIPPTSPQVSDISGLLTTPPRYSHMLATPLHSTPRQFLRSKLNNNKISTQSKDTPPLSISTLSSNSTLQDHTHNQATQDHTQKQVINDCPAPIEPIDHTHTPTDHTQASIDSDQSIDDTLTPIDCTQLPVDHTHNSYFSGNNAETSNNKLSKNDIIYKIVDNYKKGHSIKKHKGHSIKGKGHSIKVNYKSKGKHYPVSKSNGHHSNNTDNCHHGDNNLLSIVEQTLPGIQISPSTIKRYWTIEMNKMRARMLSPTGTNPITKKACDIEKRQNSLVEIMRKDITHSQRMQLLSQEKTQRIALQSLIHNQQIASVRAKKYFKDYELAIRNKLQNRRTKEQKVFRSTYEECLKLIKGREQEMKQSTREKQLIEIRKYEIEIESMEKYYQDQLEMIANAIKEDEKHTKTMNKSQKQEMLRAERELRQSMETEISKLWAGLENWEENCVHFRELDKEQLIKKLI